MKKESYLVKCPKNINTNRPVEAVVPGSKSITNRALLLAAMANGTSTLKGCLTSDDARHFLECLKTLGFPVTEVPDGLLGSDITITGFGGDIPNKKAEIYVGSAGTAARFLVAMLAFSKGEYIVNSSEQMKKRPMQPLIDALRAAGAEVECLEAEGHFPLRIVGAGEQDQMPDSFTVDIGKSSQFLSALLIAVGTLGKKATIHVVGAHGLSYVDLTAEMMRSFGVSVEKWTSDEQIHYEFTGEGRYKALEYTVEPDMSAAAYFYALAAVLGAKISVKGVTSYMLQGDVEFLHLLEKMGCCVEEDRWGTILVSGPESGCLKGGFTIDMSAFSDQALTLAAIAPFADGPITITGIGHIRLQECDRISAIAKNLTALGIQVDEKENEVTIYPGTPGSCELETYNDHRVAMSFALTGLRTEGVTILDPDCCAKTFVEYFEVLEKVLASCQGSDHMGNIRIEKAQLQDIDAVESLYNAVCDYLAGKEFNPGWERGCFPTRNEALYYMEDDGLYVARENGKIVGAVGLTHRPNGESNEEFRGDETIYEDMFFVHVLAVHPEHFRKGIASRLLDFAEQLGRQENVKKIKLDVYEKNTVAIKTYEKSGFVYVGKEDIGLGEFGMDWFYLYEKVIG